MLDHVDSTYHLQNLVSKKDFKANIHRLHLFYFDPNKVNPQEVAVHDDEEFIVESILSHQGDLTEKTSLTFKVRWLGYTADFDSWEPWRNVIHVDKLHEYLISIDQAKLIPKKAKIPRTNAT